MSKVSGEGGYWCILRWGFLFVGVDIVTRSFGLCVGISEEVLTIVREIHIHHAPLSLINPHYIESSHAITFQNPTYHPLTEALYVMWVSGDIREYGVMRMLGYSCMGILCDVDGWD